MFACSAVQAPSACFLESPLADYGCLRRPPAARPRSDDRVSGALPLQLCKLELAAAKDRWVSAAE
eukprot:12963186-Alexandrium_andersonii.AAC.1